MSQSNDRFIRLPEVLTRVGLSRSAVYAMIKEGSFPAPIKLTARAAGWIEKDIVAWVRRKTKRQ